MRKLITARAHKNIRTARMLANAPKDHSIPLLMMFQLQHPSFITQTMMNRRGSISFTGSFVSDPIFVSSSMVGGGSFGSGGGFGGGSSAGGGGRGGSW